MKRDGIANQLNFRDRLSRQAPRVWAGYTLCLEERTTSLHPTASLGGQRQGQGDRTADP